MSKHVTVCTWDDIPHLSAEEKASLLLSILPYQRDARTKGVPQLGSGAVFGLPEDEIRIDDFLLPPHWPRGYGMDAGGGAHPTAASFGVLDPASDILYIYSVYKRVSPEPAVHAAAIKARGDWLPGVGDTSALIMTQHDAEQLIAVYTRLGLHLALPDKAVESGIVDIWERLSTGRFKVFRSCAAFFEEWRLYRRDDKGRIVKANDDLMDATRYLVRSGIKRMKTPAQGQKKAIEPPRGVRAPFMRPRGTGTAGWMT